MKRELSPVGRLSRDPDLFTQWLKAFNIVHKRKNFPAGYT